MLKIMNGMKTNILESLSQILLLIKSRLPSRLPAPSPHIDDLESQSSQPQPSPSNTTSESQAPPSPQSPSGVRDPLPPTITESQRNNILDAKPDLEKELKKTLLSLCFGAALQITIQCKQVAESEINNSVSLLSLGTAAIFASLFTSHFIGEKMPNTSRMLDKVAFFLAATTFFFAIATPCPLAIKCAIWAVYIMSSIAIAICNSNFLVYSGGALTYAAQVTVG
ncbi:IMAP FAMILY MEMBER 1 putative-RELATED [Salix purpurea]|uniref:IMAP FAMILY MEMBER 1 putative-RELATED n=1 Tax=Salix purpurea TaxID=77065 RepID=A0A9Q0ZNT3_SALPP|nr:IMAP FAMILY MEMBER 1 putative-RELATED [Salix purpurea]